MGSVDTRGLAVGVDGYRKGWVAVVLRDGRYESAAVFDRIRGVIDAHGAAAAIGVDIPIGVPDAGTRACDRAARVFVGGRRASVFMTPTRSVLMQPFTAGLGVTAQAYALRDRILEVDAVARTVRRLVEVHPEVSFAAMGGAPLADHKKSWNGMWHRLALLERAGIELPPDPGPGGRAGPDDFIDAAAVAWTAARYARGEAQRLPQGSEGDAPAIWY
jgi:predicted RNase H-like nuclease